jgi:hypothetical protein
MSLATGAAGAMTFPQHLVLWLHVAFAVFTVGPVTVAIMSTPRYIRQHNTQIVRYLSRITFVFTLASLGVIIAGIALGQMLKIAGKPWLIVSMTLFLVAIVLLALIVRDQRRAIRTLEESSEHGTEAVAPAAAATIPAEAAAADPQPGDGTEPPLAEPTAPVIEPAGSKPAHHLATVERGRIAMLGGVVSLIYLVILVLMVWNS